MYDSELFTWQLMDNWEYTPAGTWDLTIQHFATEYDKIGRAKQREAERKAAGYSSATSLTLERPPTTVAASKMATEALEAVSEYALALKVHVNELETLVDDRTIATAPSVLTKPKVAAATTTQPANADLAELKAIFLAQQKQMDTALAQIKKLTGAGGGGGGGGGRGNGHGGGRGSSHGGGDRGGASKTKPKKKRHICTNCKRLIYHNDDVCMELDKNAHLHYDGWKSCLG